MQNVVLQPARRSMAIHHNKLYKVDTWGCVLEG